jgi:hypothetical protein
VRDAMRQFVAGGRACLRCVAATARPRVGLRARSRLRGRERSSRPVPSGPNAGRGRSSGGEATTRAGIGFDPRAPRLGKGRAREAEGD